MNDARKQNMAERVAQLDGFRSLSGAVVLEIGADKDGVAAQMLFDKGAHTVISTNMGPNWPSESEGRRQTRNVDARALPQAFERASIDVIFGVAVLEHINGLAEFFSGASQVLRPGGLLYAHGGPIWSSARGHHLWVDGEETAYRFSAESNPIPLWAHLLHDRPSLIADMVSRGIPTGDAEKIGDWVYCDERINRVGYRSMCNAFKACDMTLVEQIDAAFKSPSSELLAAIKAGPYGGEERFEVSGITFVATR